MRLDIPAPKNDDVERLARVVDALVDGDDDRAVAELAPIAGMTYAKHPTVKLPELTRTGSSRGMGSKTKNPPNRIIAQIHVRNGFTCAYCARMTIPLPVLRLISVRFGEAFGYHLNWKADATHRLYWDIQTSLDHLVPVSGGGDWQALDNLTTACSRCQYQKGNLTLDALGWEPRRWQSQWDGLTSHHRALWETVGQPEARYQRQWIACYEEALGQAHA
jgi:5-methylcytosine-specific restriction endonuclease McrA